MPPPPPNDKDDAPREHKDVGAGTERTPDGAPNLPEGLLQSADGIPTEPAAPSPPAAPTAPGQAADLGAILLDNDAAELERRRKALELINSGDMSIGRSDIFREDESDAPQPGAETGMRLEDAPPDPDLEFLHQPLPPEPVHNPAPGDFVGEQAPPKHGADLVGSHGPGQHGAMEWKHLADMFVPDEKQAAAAQFGESATESLEDQDLQSPAKPATAYAIRNDYTPMPKRGPRFAPVLWLIVSSFVVLAFFAALALWLFGVFDDSGSEMLAIGDCDLSDLGCPDLGDDEDAGASGDDGEVATDDSANAPGGVGGSDPGACEDDDARTECGGTADPDDPVSNDGTSAGGSDDSGAGTSGAADGGGSSGFGGSGGSGSGSTGGSEPAADPTDTPTPPGPTANCEVGLDTYLDGEEDSPSGPLRRVRLDITDEAGAKAAGHTAVFAIDKSGLKSQAQATTGPEGRITLKVSQPVEGDYKVEVASVSNPDGEPCAYVPGSATSVEWANGQVPTPTFGTPTLAPDEAMTTELRFVGATAHPGYHEMRYEITVLDSYGAPLGTAQVTWRFRAADGTEGTTISTSDTLGKIPLVVTTTAYGPVIVEIVTAARPGYVFDQENSDTSVTANAAP